MNKGVKRTRPTDDDGEDGTSKKGRKGNVRMENQKTENEVDDDDNDADADEEGDVKAEPVE